MKVKATQNVLNGAQRQLDHYTHEYDVCVIGGGMAGMCAAIASARRGAKTALIQDRPVLGGNASSEVRMWICGAHGRNVKETGILEEIQLENCYRNPDGNYSVWDSVLYEKVAFCENLTLMLNTSCLDANCHNGKIESIRCWQLTSQSYHTVFAKIFIDCSGDSILAPLTGASFRWGRESREEFDEDIQPWRADRKTMGNSLLLQLRETSEACSYIPPDWAYVFDTEKEIRNRIGESGLGQNFWWLEIGGLQNTISDAEAIRHELMRITYGIWDYMKNKGPKKMRDRTQNWAIEWVGSLPGKRENRRYQGPHIMTQNDIRSGGQFDDIIAYGGWTMDDHHPAGLAYPGSPTIFHPAPSPYGIPYRSLYSVDIDNLMFAGRNISVTHAALSSTRVMGTTSLIGQAAGTAAALCTSLNCLPKNLFPQHITTLQNHLQQDDCWLPGLTCQANPLTARAQYSHEVLRNGWTRPNGNERNAWEGHCGDSIDLAWSNTEHIGGLRLIFDSNLNNAKKMPCRYPLKGVPSGVPFTMVKAFRIEVKKDNGVWETVFRESNNYQRRVELSLDCKARNLRFIPEQTWGASSATLYSLEALSEVPNPSKRLIRQTWSSVVSNLSTTDLEAPQMETEQVGRESLYGA